jgi:catechol 2,3-dioxygenase-like lactoylglutathione lyase family enzyme
VYVEPRLTIVTLGVDDLARSLAFYREGLGLPSDGIVGQEYEYGAVAFFKLRGGLTFALFPRTSIAHDATVPVGPRSATEMTIAHNVRSQAEVDELVARAERAGAQVVKPPGPTFWGGYAGYFADPDGHLWEIAFNPKLPLDV